MSKWKMVKLGEVATYINGFAFKPSDWCETGLPIIRIQNLTNSSKEINYYDKSYNPKYEVNKGDILISWSASLGVYEWKKDKALLNQHIFKVVFDKLDIDKNFFVYSIQTLLTQMAVETHGATMKHITKPKFDNMPFPLPPLEEQKRIADILDKASNLIELRKQQLEKMDLLIKSKFIYMFGDPVTNPKGWEKGTIRDVVSDVKYGTSAPSVENGKYIYLRMNNITYNGHLDLSSIKHINVSDNEFEKYVVRKGDILFNRTNSKELVGKTCVFKEDVDMIIAGYIIRVRVNKKVNSEYLSAVLNSKYGKNTLFDMCKAIVGQANINAQELQNIKILIPPIELQNQFATFVEQVEKQKAVMQQSLEKMETNYKALMQEYFG